MRGLFTRNREVVGWTIVWVYYYCHSVHALVQQPPVVHKRAVITTGSPWTNKVVVPVQPQHPLLLLLSRESFLVGTFASLLLLQPPQIVHADEIGIEQDAPTIVTGETVEICTKRGPLGACLKTELRTEQNDNDRAVKYFGQKSIPIPTEPALAKMGKRQQTMLVEEEDDLDNNNNNALIQKLRQQSIDNKERNDLAIQRKTFENNQAANFGPFDRKVLIMNTDGRTYTLLENPIAMRLKQAGFIDNRRVFIKQPTVEDMTKAEQDAATSGGLFQSLFGSTNS